MDQKPRISVILPVYNNERYLGEAIDSILSQTFEDFELIIVSEFGTSVASTEIIDSFNDERIRHIRKGGRPGLARSLNLGLGLARAKLIARMDSDDVSEKQRFAKQIAHLDAHPELAVIGSWNSEITPDGRVTRINPVPFGPKYLKWAMLFNCQICHSSVLARKSALLALGGYPEDAEHCEDYALWLRLMEQYSADNLPEVLVRVRIHGACTTVLNRDTVLQNSFTFSHKNIQNLVGRDVPPAPFKATVFGDYPTGVEESTEILDLLDEILGHFLAKEAPDTNELRDILNDHHRRKSAPIISLIKTKGRRMPVLLVRSNSAARYVPSIDFAKRAVSILLLNRINSGDG